MKKKSKAPVAIAICAVVLFAAAVIFIAAKGFQDGRTDPDKARFERELKEKYGEEFVCLEARYEHTIGFNSPTFYEGECAPKKDTNLAFEAAQKKIVDAMRENGIALTVQVQLYFSPPDMYGKCLELLLSYEKDTLSQLLNYINEYEHEVGQHTKKYNRTMRVNDEYSRDKYIEERGNIDD